MTIEEPSLDIQFDEETSDGAIDFGEETVDFGGDIDFGADGSVDIELTPSGDIDWGNIEAVETSDGAQVNY